MSTISLVLAVASVLGFVSSYTMGWSSAVLLALSVAVMAARVLCGRKPIS